MLGLKAKLSSMGHGRGHGLELPVQNSTGRTCKTSDSEARVPNVASETIKTPTGISGFLIYIRTPFLGNSQTERSLDVYKGVGKPACPTDIAGDSAISDANASLDSGQKLQKSNEIDVLHLAGC